jgi:YD repeat-containing protein
MKKLLLLTTLALSVIQQTNAQRTAETIYTNVSGNNEYKTVITYNTNGNMTISVDYYWDNAHNYWLESDKGQYFYDANGIHTEEIFSYWDNGNWVDETKNTYTYDSKGNIMERIVYSWKNTVWVERDKNKYDNSYDSKGNLTEYVFSEWTGSNWEETERFTYTYDENGNRTEEIFSLAISGIWIEINKNTYKYDTNKNLTEEIYSWNNNGNWDDMSKMTYTYDSNGDLVGFLACNWDTEFASWELFRIGNTTYNGSTAIKSHTNIAISLYPNPTTENVVIEQAEGYSLRISNTSGITMYTCSSLSESETINTATWPKGTYIVQVQSDSSKAVKKLIKK